MPVNRVRSFHIIFRVSRTVQVGSSTRGFSSYHVHERWGVSSNLNQPCAKRGICVRLFHQVALVISFWKKIVCSPPADLDSAEPPPPEISFPARLPCSGPPVSSDYQPTGSISKVGDLDTYLAGENRGPIGLGGWGEGRRKRSRYRRPIATIRYSHTLPRPRVRPGVIEAMQALRVCP